MESISNINMEELKLIYSKILDEKSKGLFIKRLIYSVTGNFEYMINVDMIKEIEVKLKQLEQDNRTLIMFGAGINGKNLVKHVLKDINWECFADNNRTGELLGLKIINVNELKEKYPDAIIVISPWKVNAEIYNQLIEIGINKENIINLGAHLLECFEKQYFDILPNENEKESFVDCGCLNGDTSKLFMKWCNNNYSNVWAFEPDPINYEVCKRELDIINCQVYNMGVFDKEGIINFSVGGDGGSNITENGKHKIKIAKLDDILGAEKVTFIKMDIEGAELKALIGAEKIIREQKPKLAICIYHKPEDVITIPKLILEYNQDYKFMIRHYGLTNLETVLYAF